MLKTISSPTQQTYIPTSTGMTVTVNSAYFSRVGNLVTVFFDVTFGSSVSADNCDLSLPTSGAVTWGTGQVNYTDIGTSLVINVDPSADKILFRSGINAANLSKLSMSGIRVIASASYLSE